MDREVPDRAVLVPGGLGCDVPRTAGPSRRSKRDRDQAWSKPENEQIPLLREVILPWFGGGRLGFSQQKTGVWFGGPDRWFTPCRE